MRVTVKKDREDEFPLYSFCPICSNKVNVEFDDYVEKHPMIWCWHWDNNCGDFCNSKFVIDSSIEDITTKDYDLLPIVRIANSDAIDDYINNHNILTEDFNEALNYIDTDKDVAYKKILDEVGVELNSYNIGDINKKYPEYDLEHSGIHILIEVLEKDGSLTRMTFWGD